MSKLYRVDTDYALLRKEDMDKTPVLETRHLGIQFGGLKAVDDVNITVGKTEIAGLIGPNGAGKTTIFNLLTKVYKPTHGSIFLNQVDINGYTPEQANEAGVARTFQNIRLFQDMSVLDNVMAGLHREIKYSMLDSTFRTAKFKDSERKAAERAVELLSLFNMESDAYTKAGSLPYGAQRRLEILRAMATNPCLLLLDEPAAGMNPSETAELMETIKKIRDTFQIGILLIEHDMNLVMNVCDGIGVLNFGKLIAKGSAEDIKNNPVVIEAYLGKQKGESVNGTT